MMDGNHLKREGKETSRVLDWLQLLKDWNEVRSIQGKAEST